MSLNNLDAIKLRMALEDAHVDIADEWISEVASLQQQLAAERAKVAALEHQLDVGVTTPTKLPQSSDAPADIRREVAPECVKCLRSQADEHAEWAADLICAKFGVKP